MTVNLNTSPAQQVSTATPAADASATQTTAAQTTAAQTTAAQTTASTGPGSQVQVDAFTSQQYGDLIAALQTASKLHIGPAHGQSFIQRLFAALTGKTSIQQALRLAQARTGEVKKKKKRRGLFGGLFKKIGKAIGNAFEKIGNFLLKFGPIIFGVMMLIPGLNVVGLIGLAAIAAYKAIKQGDILGAVLTIAGAVTGGAASALGTAASTAIKVAAQVTKYARMAQQGLKAIQAAKDGNWLGAIAGAASAVAGGVGSGAEKVAASLEKVAVWAKRAETAARAWKSAKNGDVFGAIGIGASLAGDITENPELADTFGKVATGAKGLKGVETALESGDYLGAAALLTDTGAQLTTGKDKELLNKLSTSTRAVSVASQAIGQKNWSTAGASLAAASGLWVGKEETKDLLMTTAKGLDLAGQAYRSAERRNWISAATLLKAGIDLVGEFEAREDWRKDQQDFAARADSGQTLSHAA